MMTNYLIIPGYKGSGEKHWQTYMESRLDNSRRVNQKDWEHPDVDEWVRNLDRAAGEYDPASLVLVAHSLGCLIVAEWVKRYGKSVRAALLVAPPDTALLRERISGDLFPEEPLPVIDFPSLVVASADDPWAKLHKAEYYAGKWGSRLINIGRAGHINEASGHYRWDEGFRFLELSQEPFRS